MAKRPALGKPLLMDIIENRSYFDTLDDEVGQLIKKIDPLQKQSVYRQAKNDLFKFVTRHRGEMFRFRKERMSLRSVNDSVLIKVGPKKRGHLAAYRGEWIRVIWHSTYGFSMDCLVHKVKVTKEVEKQLVPRGPYTGQCLPVSIRDGRRTRDGPFNQGELGQFYPNRQSPTKPGSRRDSRRRNASQARYH